VILQQQEWRAREGISLRIGGFLFRSRSITLEPGEERLSSRPVRVRGKAAMGDVVSVTLTRTELVALKETIELTPVFDGRTEARGAIQAVLRENPLRPPPLRIDEAALLNLTQRIVPIDVPTANLRSKLGRELKRAQTSS
jgi:hypothetical protein